MKKRTKHPLYGTYQSMKNRCLNPNNHAYHRYGGRGILICERWLDKKSGFDNFIIDMGKKPSPKHTVDRIDNDGNYEPANCRWATPHQQAANRLQASNHPGVHKIYYQFEKRWVWRAFFSYDGEVLLNKMFNNFSDALKARKEIENHYYSEA